MSYHHASAKMDILDDRVAERGDPMHYGHVDVKGIFSIATSKDRSAGHPKIIMKFVDNIYNLNGEGQENG